MARTKPGARAKLGGAARRRDRDRKSLAWVASLAAVLLLLAGGYSWMIGAGAPSRRAVIGGPFQLVQGDGQLVTDRSFPGKYLLIYFGYTSCQDVCPATLASVAAALDDLGERASQVQPLFITIDPDRDTPSEVQRYAMLFSPRLLGLTGSQQEIHKVADAYQVSGVAHHGAMDAAGYVVDHSSVLYLMGPDGRYIAPIRADEPGAGMARIIAGHLSS